VLLIEGTIIGLVGLRERRCHEIQTARNKGDMADYIDGFVLPIRKDQVDLYRSIARDAGKIWREYGALEYRECIAEDMDAKEMVSFRQLAGAKDDETVVFAWIVFESRASRDEVNAKVVADPRLKNMCAKGQMPFDYKRMAYGGFETLVEA
jgi:uncharacterized protein YbaA (DUF1428 family)